jgi:malate dehydrogenase (quinone)
VTHPTAEYDVALIGGGIMSATLGVMLQQLQPDWSIVLYERLDRVAAESSGGWNNAGTGHAAFCEMNYTPERNDGSVDVSRAVKINQQYYESRQLWSYLVGKDVLQAPETFIHSVPHLAFCAGDDVDFLRRRFEAMSRYAQFAHMSYTEDRDTIASWIPLMMEGRDPRERIAVTRSDEGTDVDFGAMTRQMIDGMQRLGADLRLHTSIHGLRKERDGWDLTVHNRKTGESIQERAKFVFVGAGGRAIQLLQQANVAEARGFAGFPVSGQFFRCKNPALIERHSVKVYGKPHLGAPPMSAPHLDTRVIDGQPGLLFGPYAGFSPRLLKHGSWRDFFGSIRLHNILTMLTVAKDEVPLTKYLIGQVLQSNEKRMDALREFIPEATTPDWELLTAGQRVQVMRPTPKKRGILQFGTELICAADGSIAGLLGASPGASTGTSIMVDLIRQCFPDHLDRWAAGLEEMIPSYGRSLEKDPQLLERLQAETDRVLHLTSTPVSTV